MEDGDSYCGLPSDRRRLKIRQGKNLHEQQKCITEHCSNSSIIFYGPSSLIAQTPLASTYCGLVVQLAVETDAQQQIKVVGDSTPATVAAAVEKTMALSYEPIDVIDANELTSPCISLLQAIPGRRCHS